MLDKLSISFGNSSCKFCSINVTHCFVLELICGISFNFTLSKTLFNEFTTAFNDADELVLMDIYAAREKDTGLVSSDELGDAIRKTGLKCTNVHSHDEATSYIKEHAKSGDVVLTVGAGDVVLVGEKYLAE